ncbi:uncharacterized protein LOC114522506 isoform X2 [Dendronephthya gigantea]|uniref:uncharacterized protein LOC114522506 isoform X2 n=1 Tax=Dendronephthya gigantea TaxID=151771 RepID=UPI001069E085|nr:uncharacterized protein LOC114522506 isoform X2 [Dendronephthya gigantea]
MLKSADNLLKKRQEHFKVPAAVEKLNYTPCTSKEPSKKEISRVLGNSLGEVNRGSMDETFRYQTMDRHFDEKKTVKISGVSQLLQDLIEKEFQARGNTAKYNDDVMKTHVCPDGEDCVLVEFCNNLPAASTRSIGNTLSISGIHLAVERWKPKAEKSEAVGSQSVSRIWGNEYTLAEMDEE